MKILHRSRKGGFTLIEMLVVIAIIAILTGIIITGLVGSKAKARDAKRASDLSQIALALEQFLIGVMQYPANITDSLITTGTWQVVQMIANGNPVTLGKFYFKNPTDPSTSGSYDYAVNNSTNQPIMSYIPYSKLLIPF